MSTFSSEYPFRIGAQYRVKRSFKALRDHFKEGEILIFDSKAWSRYDGITGYFFTQAGVAGNRSWDIDDDESIEIWRELFEPLN